MSGATNKTALFDYFVLGAGMASIVIGLGVTPFPHENAFSLLERTELIGAGLCSLGYLVARGRGQRTFGNIFMGAAIVALMAFILS